MKVSPLARTSSKNRRRRAAGLALAGSIAALLAVRGMAVPLELLWDENGQIVGVTDGSGTWNTSDSNVVWNEGSVGGQGGANRAWKNPGAGGVTDPSNATFGAGGEVGGTVTVQNGGGIVVGNITFGRIGLNGPVGPRYTIQGTSGAVANSLFLSPGTVITTHFDATIAARITTNGFTKAGAGRLVLQGSLDPQTQNNYTGVINVNAGILQVGGNFSTNGAIAGNLIVNTGGTFRLAQSEIIVNTAVLTVNGGALADFAGFSERIGAISGSGRIMNAAAGTTLTLGAGTQNFTGLIRGPINLTIDGANQTLSSANTYTGATTLTSGTLTLANPLAAHLSTVNANSPNALKFATAGAYTLGGLSGSADQKLEANDGGAVTLRVGNNNVSSVYNGALTNATIGASGLTKIGSSVLTLAPTAAHTYAGATTVAGGTLALDFTNFAAPNMINSASALTIGNGGILVVNGSGTAATSQTFGSFNLTSGGSTLRPVANGGMDVTLNLPSTWTHQAGSTLNVDLTAAANVSVASNPTGQLVNGVIPYATVSDNLTNIGFATIDTGKLVIANGTPVADAQSFTDATANYDVTASSGLAVLAGSRTANTARYLGSGLNTIDLGASGANTLTLNALMNLGGNSEALTIMRSGGSGSLRIGATNELAIHLMGSGNVRILAPITNNGANASSVSVNANSPINFLFLGGANTYSGGTYLNGGITVPTIGTTGPAGAPTSGPFGTGTLVFAGGSIRGDSAAGPVTIGNNIAFQSDTLIPNGGDPLTFSGTTTLSGGTRTLTTTSSAPVTFSGAIVDGAEAAGIRIAGGAVNTVIFTGTNTYTGLTSVNSGILQIGDGRTFGTLGTGPVAVTSTLAFNRGDDFLVLNEIRGDGNVQQNAASVLTLANALNNVGGLVIGAEGGVIDISAQGLALNGIGLRANQSGTIQATGGGILAIDAVTSLGAADFKTLTVNAGIKDGALRDLVFFASSTLAPNGAGVVVLNGANSYSGITDIRRGIVSVSQINSVVSNQNNGAVHTPTSNLGSPASVEDGVIKLGFGTSSGTLRYTGLGETTDRIIDLAGSSGGGVIENTGPGLLKLTSNFRNSGSGTHTLVLQGTGNGEIAGSITDDITQISSKTSVTKLGSGTWTLSGFNNYTGPTTVSAGKLVVDTSNNSTVIRLESNLIMRGGTFQLQGAGNATQKVSGMQLPSGANIINLVVNGGSTTLDLRGQADTQGITRALGQGTVDYRSTGGTIGTTALVVTAANNNDASGITGTWSTVNGGAAFSRKQAGTTNILEAYPGNGNGTTTGYEERNALGGVVNETGSISKNVRFSLAGSAGNVTLSPSAGLPNTVRVNSLTQGTFLAPAVVDTLNKTLRLGIAAAPGLAGSLQITPNGGTFKIGVNPGDGQLSASGTNNTTAANLAGAGEIILGNHSTLFPLIVNANIVNNSVAISGGSLASLGSLRVRVTKTGVGEATLAGTNNTFDAGVQLYQGKLNLNHGTALGTGGTLTIFGGALDNTSGAPITLQNGNPMSWFGDFAVQGTNHFTTGTGVATITADQVRTLTVNGAGFTMGGVINGAGSTLIKAGPGDLNLASGSPNNFDGGLIVAGGTVTALNSTTTFGDGDVILGSPTSAVDAALAGNNRTYPNLVRAAAGAGGTLTLRNAPNATPVFSGTIAVDNSLTLASVGNGSLTQTGTMIGLGSLAITGGATPANAVFLNGNNAAFRGPIGLGAGYVQIGTGTALGNSLSGTTIGPGASLDLNGQTVDEPMSLASTGVNGSGALINTSATPAGNHGDLLIIAGSSFGGSGDLTLDGDIGSTAAFDFVKIGTGTALLSGTNTYTGITRVGTGGTLQFGKRVSLYNAQTTLWNEDHLEVQSGGTLAFNVGAADEFTAADVASLIALGSATSGFRNGSSVGLDTTNALGGNFVYATPIVNPNGGANALGLTKLGAGTLTLQAANSYTGPTVVKGGTLLAQTPGSLPGGTAASLTAAGAALDLNNNSQTLSSLSGVAGTSLALGSATLTFGDATNTTFAGVISGTPAPGANSLVKEGQGDVILSGANTYTGNTLISSGSLVLGNATALGDTAGTTTVASGATLDLNGQTIGETLNIAGTGEANSGVLINSSLTPAATTGSITLSGDSSIGGAGPLALNGMIGGNFGLTKIGTGATTLAGNNTYTGLTTVSGGTLILGNAAALGTTGAGTTVASGAVVDLNGQSVSEALTLSGTGIGGTGALINSQPAAATVSGPVTLAANTSIGGANPITLSGGVSGGFALSKVGAGTLILSGPSTYTGPTTVEAGTLHLAQRVAFANAVTANWTPANLIVRSGAALGLNVGGAGEFTAADLDLLLPLGTATGGFQNNSTVRLDTTNAAGGNFAYGGVIANTNGGANVRNLEKVGPGTLTLSGANTYTGTTTISAGTLSATGVGSLPSRTAVTIATGATLDLAGSAQTIASLSGVAGSNVTLGAGILTVGDDASTTFAGNMTGAGGLTKQGAGTLTLTGANTYTGRTTVNRGVLAVDLVSSLNPVLNESSQLVLGGGTFRLIGQPGQQTEQRLNGVLVTGGGASVVEVTNNGIGTILNLTGPTSTAGFSRALGQGTVDFRATTGTLGIGANTANIAIFQPNNSSTGIIGPWATVNNGADFAVRDGSGFMVAYTGYQQSVNAFGSTILEGTNNNVRITGTGGGANLLLAGAAATNINTLQQNTGTAATVDITAAQTLRVGSTTAPTTGLNGNGVGGFFIAPTRANLTIGNVVNQGIVTAGGTATNIPGEVILGNFSTAGELRVNSVIANNGTAAVIVTKAGGGTASVHGTNTYTGGTNIDAGTLLVNGSIAGSTAIVRGGGTLGGIGTVGATNTLVQAGGTLSPGGVTAGTALGTLNTNNLSLNDDSIFKFDIAGPGSSDRVNVTGSVTLGSLSTGPTLVASFLNNYAVQPGDTFTLILNDGNASDPVIGMFAQGTSYTQGAVTFEIKYNGGDGNDVTALVMIPEPTSAGLLLGALAPLALGRFRRRK